jgi:hypothetical protein
MTGLRVTYIASLVILGVLLVFTLLVPTTSEDKFSQVGRVQLRQIGDGWTVEFDIINREGKDTDYPITVSIDGKLYTETVSVIDGRTVTYTYHVSPHMLGGGDVSFTVYKEGEPEPIEQVTYYLR